MRQVAELPAAEWVVAEILDDGAAVCIGVRLRNLVFRQRRKSLEQQKAGSRPSRASPQFPRASERNMQNELRLHISKNQRVSATVDILLMFCFSWMRTITKIARQTLVASGAVVIFIQCLAVLPMAAYKLANVRPPEGENFVSVPSKPWAALVGRTVPVDQNFFRGHLASIDLFVIVSILLVNCPVERRSAKQPT